MAMGFRALRNGTFTGEPREPYIRTISEIMADR